jgi:hypothetical protein
MGIQASGRRIVFLFDVSGSVVNKSAASGMPMSRIREETIAFLDRLGINSRFALVQFVRNYKKFRDEMLPATDPNKEAAREWINTQWSETGTMSAGGKGVVSELPNGIERVLTDAFANYQPDVVFIVSDGSFWKSLPGKDQTKVDYRELRRHLAELQKSLPSPAQVHFVGFQMRPDEKKELSSIIRANKGRLREIGQD